MFKLFFTLFTIFFLFPLHSVEFEQPYALTHGAKIIHEMDNLFQTKDSIAFQCLTAVDSEFIERDLPKDLQEYPDFVRKNWEQFEIRDREKDMQIAILNKQINAICDQYPNNPEYQNIKLALSTPFNPTAEEANNLKEYKNYQNFLPSKLEKHCNEKLLKEMDLVSEKIQIAKATLMFQLIDKGESIEKAYPYHYLLERELIERLKKLATNYNNEYLQNVLGSVEKKLPFLWAEKINHIHTFLGISESTQVANDQKGLTQIKQLLHKRAQIQNKYSNLKDIKNYLDKS